jgi:hypothetical protein
MTWDPFNWRSYMTDVLFFGQGPAGHHSTNLLHILREFYMEGEEAKRPVEWLIRRVVKVGSRISYHIRYWWVHVVSAFPLRHHYHAVLGHG